MKIIGTELYDKGFDYAINELLELVNSNSENILISPSDAHVLVLGKKDFNFRQILNQFYWNLPDGVPSVWLLKLKGAKKATRIGGPDLFKEIIIQTKDTNLTHYLCGGKEGVAEQLRDTCNTWGNTNIIGLNSPPFKTFSEQDYKKLAEEINQTNANFLWIGLGAPKQLYFAHAISKYTNVNCIITIGAAFDFHTNRMKKAPKWIQKIGFEWFFRLIQEPKRLGKRYLKTIPLFVWYNITDLFKRRKLSD